MREVLFRGKTKTGFWIEGFLFQTTCDGVQEWCISSSPLSANDYSEILGDYGEVIPESISEFTGLTDKNGKKIFEGDIIVIDHTIKTYDWEEIPETYKPRRSRSLFYDDTKDQLTYKRNYAVEWKKKGARWIL